MIRIPAAVNTASDAVMNLASLFRIRNLSHSVLRFTVRRVWCGLQAGGLAMASLPVLVGLRRNDSGTTAGRQRWAVASRTGRCLQPEEESMSFGSRVVAGLAGAIIITSLGAATAVAASASTATAAGPDSGIVTPYPTTYAG
jgi:hypothetical protein